MDGETYGALGKANAPAHQTVHHANEQVNHWNKAASPEPGQFTAKLKSRAKSYYRTY